MTATLERSQAPVAPPRSLLMRSEMIDSSAKALHAMSVALEVPGVVSVSAHVAAQSIFVVYARPEARRKLKIALEGAGYPLLV